MRQGHLSPTTLRRALPHPVLCSCPHPELLTPPARSPPSPRQHRSRGSLSSLCPLFECPRLSAQFWAEQRHYWLQNPSVPGSLRRPGASRHPTRPGGGRGQHWGRTRHPRRSPTKAARRMRRLRRGRHRAKPSAPTSITARPRPGAPACPALPRGAGPICSQGWKRQHRGGFECVKGQGGLSWKLERLRSRPAQPALTGSAGAAPAARLAEIQIAQRLSLSERCCYGPTTR